MTKAIYLLRPVAPHTGPSVVVRAACEQCARSAAAAQAELEGTAYWRDPERTSVVRVKETGISGTVLRRELYARKLQGLPAIGAGLYGAVIYEPHQI